MLIMPHDIAQPIFSQYFLFDSSATWKYNKSKSFFIFSGWGERGAGEVRKEEM